MENEEYPLAKFVRLTNGDDIVAEVVETEDEKGILYMLINPLKVIYVQSPQHQNYLTVSFIPWVFPRICDHQEFTIHANDVLMVSNVSEKMNDYYWNNLDTLDHHKEDPQPEPDPEPDEQSLLDMFRELSLKRTFH